MRAANPERVVSGADSAWEMPDDRDQHREDEENARRRGNATGEEEEGTDVKVFRKNRNVRLAGDYTMRSKRRGRRRRSRKKPRHRAPSSDKRFPPKYSGESPQSLRKYDGT